MDVLAHCKIYPISNYINVIEHNEPVSENGLVHLFIDEIKNKSYQWVHQRRDANSNKMIVVIDLLNVWIPNRYTVKRNYTLPSLIKFLNDELYCGAYFNQFGEGLIFEGLIIDNLSIYSFESVKLFNILFGLLVKIRHKYGCWIKTVSFRDIPIPAGYLAGMQKSI
ncbi:hypothetical protein MOSE0_C02256 [Monosporozyma servazzii]